MIPAQVPLRCPSCNAGDSYELDPSRTYRFFDCWIEVWTCGICRCVWRRVLAGGGAPYAEPPLEPPGEGGAITNRP